MGEMTAQQIVRELLEAEPLDSLEGVPDMETVLMPGTPENREHKLRYDPPKSAREAVARGVDWFIKQGRKYRTTIADPGQGGYPRNSHTMATNRNQRRKSFGYRDVYSTRERDWPMPNRRAFYKGQDRAEAARKDAAQAEVERLIGQGI